MGHAKRQFLLNALKLFDICLMAASFGAAAVLIVQEQAKSGVADFLAMRIKLSNCFLFAGMLLACHLIFCACSLYESRRLSSQRVELIDALRATTTSVACVLVVGKMCSVVMMTPAFLVLFWILSSLAVTGSRILLRVCLASVRRSGHDLRYMLVLGTNPRAVEFARKIAAKPERGIRILGFVDDEWPKLGEFKETEFTLVCNYVGLAEFLRPNVVDEVAVYLPFRSFSAHFSQVAELCEQHGITMRFNPDIFGLKTARARPEEVDGEYFITTYTGVCEGWPAVAKRVLDIAVSLALLVVLLPGLVLVAVLIKLTSEGPVFFLQQRIGLNKRKFLIYKFRSMVPDAEKRLSELQVRNEVSGPVFKMRQDPRITPIGRILRRTSLDELPQLLNVLKGDMSLVGPRPLPARDYEGFSEDWQRRRLSVHPGITCLWQVNGRSSIPFEQWMRLDLKYMDEWSLWLDLKILLRTVPAVWKGSGAA